VIEAIPLLPSPLNLNPGDGFRFNIEQLSANRAINFSWMPVSGANAYNFALYERTAGGQRMIRRETLYSTNWTLQDINILNRGTFEWQVEAVSIHRNGLIEQHGRPVTHSFVMDIPLPEVQVRRPGVLYGQ
jgi:hypothetical protein